MKRQKRPYNFGLFDHTRVPRTPVEKLKLVPPSSLIKQIYHVIDSTGAELMSCATCNLVVCCVRGNSSDQSELDYPNVLSFHNFINFLF